METFGTLENWSLRRGGRLQEVFATRGSSVFMLHPHSLSSIEKQASSSSYLVDESKDDGNDRDLMQSAFSLNYSTQKLAPLWRTCPKNVLGYDRSLLRQLDQMGRVNRSSSSAMQCNQGNYYLINLSFPSMCHKDRDPWT